MSNADALTITLADYDLDVLRRLLAATREWQDADPTDFSMGELANRISALETELCGCVKRLARPYGYT